MGKREWRKEYIVAASRITLVASLKTLHEKFQKNSPRKKEYNTVFKTFAIFRIVLYVILKESEQGLTIKDMLPRTLQNCPIKAILSTRSA